MPDTGRKKEAPKLWAQTLEESTYSKLKVAALDQMVDRPKLGGISRAVLFLQNKEADLLSETGAMEEKFLSTFGVNPRPKLVINLCMSKGFRDHVDSVRYFDPAFSAGMVHGHPPWPNPDNFGEELDVEQKLQRFMSEVILPLAEQTNALILCSAIRGMCALTQALTKVVAVNRQRWAELPFSIVYTTPMMLHLYCSAYRDQWWKSLCKKSKRWKRSDESFRLALQRREKDGLKTDLGYFDLERLGQNFLLVDSLSDDLEFGHNGPYNNLMTKLLGCFWTSFPVIAIKTRFS